MTDNLIPFPEEQLGGKAALLRYVDRLFAEVESGEILGFAIAKVPPGDGHLRVAWGFTASKETPIMERMIAGVNQLLHRLNRKANGEGD